IPTDAPAGSISFSVPVTTTVSYFKIAPSYTVTFGWNMTDVLVTPTYLTFSAYCSSNKNTYPVGTVTVPGTATQLLWEPWSYQTGQQGQQTPLVQGTYTLQVMDEQGTTAIGESGRFNYYDQLTFAFYTPQSYTPLSQWTCAACKSSAVPLRPYPALTGLAVTLLVMIISGWGLLR
ncbi:hypothetical protein DL93DRAFT_2043977, partial [Clavulina sp. PMI_390]